MKTKVGVEQLSQLFLSAIQTIGTIVLHSSSDDNNRQQRRGERRDQAVDLAVPLWKKRSPDDRHGDADDHACQHTRAAGVLAQQPHDQRRPESGAQSGPTIIQHKRKDAANVTQCNRYGDPDGSTNGKPVEPLGLA